MEPGSIFLIGLAILGIVFIEKKKAQAASDASYLPPAGTNVAAPAPVMGANGQPIVSVPLASQLPPVPPNVDGAQSGPQPGSSVAPAGTDPNAPGSMIEPPGMPPDEHTGAMQPGTFLAPPKVTVQNWLPTRPLGLKINSNS